MPLQKLADQIIRVSRQHGSTPVLVTPSYLSLRQQFFLELVDALAGRSDLPIRIDWYRGVPGPLSLVGHRLATARAARINRALSRKHRRGAKIHVAASIGRPREDRRDLVVGICDGRLELPAWTTPIHLGGSPSELSTLQSGLKNAS